MRHTQLVNYTLYQIGWFACVLGGASHRPWTGFLIAVALLGAHLTLSPERSLEARLVVFATAVGAVVEMGQIAAGTYRFTSGTVMDALPPPWLLAMWAQFATTFRYSLRPVITRPVSGRAAWGRPAAHSRSSLANGWARSPCSRRSQTVCSASPSAGRSPCSSSPRSCAGLRRDGVRTTRARVRRGPEARGGR